VPLSCGRAAGARGDIRHRRGAPAVGDPSLLGAALANLIHNAWKFSSRIADARIEVGLRFEEGQRVFFVRDNGVGFDMRYAAKLFLPSNAPCRPRGSRDRHRPRHRPADHRAPRRPDLGRERARQGSRLLLRAGEPAEGA